MTQAERYYRMYDRMRTLIAVHGQIGIGIDYGTCLQRCYYWQLVLQGFTATGLTYDTCRWLTKRETQRLNRIKRTELPEYDFVRYCKKVRRERDH